MALVTTDAVVLHAFDYLESSRIIRLATRDAGVQSVLARGARRSRKRFGAALDLFASGVAQINVRDGRELQQLESFEVVNARAPLSYDLERFAAASALAELSLRWMTHDEHDEHDPFFEVLVGALDALASAPHERARDVGLAGAWRIVSALGFAPTIDVCSSCHEAIPEGDAVHFSPVGGGVTCPRCVARSPGGRSLPADARDALRAFIAGGAFALADERTRRAHLRLLREFLNHHLSDGRVLRALGSWERGETAGSNA
jgi:DNA repair protein RecO (recombination protein O)